MLAEIVLFAGTDKVTVRDIPELFATAIHPAVPESVPRQVKELHKMPMTEEAKLQACGIGHPFPVSLTAEDLKGLELAWSNLPRLELPMDEPAWQIYWDAYQNCMSQEWRGNWELQATCVDPSLTRFILWHNAVEEYTKLVLDAVNIGLLIPLSYATFLPMPNAMGEGLKKCFVTVDNLSEFAKQLQFGVRITATEVQASNDATKQNEHPSDTDWKAKEGRYTLEDAVAMLELNSGERADGMLKKLMDAVRNGELPVHEPGKRAQWQCETVREFYEEAYWDDLNKWLSVNQRRITWRFPNPDEVEVSEEVLPTATAAKEHFIKGLTKQQVITAFKGLHYKTDEQWNKALSDVPNWLLPCRVMKGKPGDNKTSALWSPVLISIALLDKEIQLRKLDAVFIGLKDWNDEWREASAILRD